MATIVTSFVVGLLFALGLGIAGMTRPEKIQGFLDLFGNWDPSLLFVMAGAVGLHFVAYRLVKRRQSPLLSQAFVVPTRRDVDGRLIFGSALFGIGWGLGGFCPGPGIVALGTGAMPVFVFVASMLAGFFTFRVVDRAWLHRQ